MQKQQLTPDEWRSKLCESRDKWARLGEDERQSYIAKAAEEEGLRREACKQPFASRGSHSSIPNCPEDGTSPAAFDAASHLGRNSLKKNSRHRVLATYRRFREAPEWAMYNCGLASYDGALHLDFIDTETRDEEIQQEWQNFVKVDYDSQKLPSQGDCAGIHHQTCWTTLGFCASSSNRVSISKLVSGMGDYAASGFLSLCYDMIHMMLFALKPKLRNSLEGRFQM